MKAKPCPIGQRFGRLTVLSKAGRLPDGKTSKQLYKCLCDCGKEIERSRSGFVRSLIASCGCAKFGNTYKKRLPDRNGEVFGQLTVIKRSLKKADHGTLWILLCSCGNVIERQRYDVEKTRGIISCGCARRRGLTKRLGTKPKYPPNADPYPAEAFAIVSKYIHLISTDHKNNRADIEDEKMDRMMRAAFTIIYRRSIGEYIDEHHEMSLVKKYIRFASLRIKARHNGTNKIGCRINPMNSIQNYPVSESQTQEKIYDRKIKKYKFMRR